MQATRFPRLALLVIAAVVMVFAACSKDTREGESSKAEAAKVSSDKADKADKATIGKMSIDQLASALDAKSCAVIDANSESTRKAQGVIPSAVLLSHYRKYDASELPEAKDKKLVFYCTNEQCGASHAAAEKALLAGYTDVNILPAGVMGWKQSGQPTQTVQ